MIMNCNSGTPVTADILIKMYDLRPHPEGGYFRESYRACESIPVKALHGRFDGDRSFSTAIYFLIPEGKKSRLHRIKSDELWHFYAGGPLRLVQISSSGEIQEVIMGQSPNNGHIFQHVVPAGSWFGAYPEKGSSFSFVGCTVAPGFDFADFELGERDALQREFPHAKDVIQLLT